MDIVLDRSLFAGITPLTPEQGEDRGTSAETGAMLLLPHFLLFSSSHKARRPQLLFEVDNNGDEYGADDDDDTGRYSGYMRDNNNDDGDEDVMKIIMGVTGILDTAAAASQRVSGPTTGMVGQTGDLS